MTAGRVAGEEVAQGTVVPWPHFGRGTLLAVHAHPDDESLWTGGLLAAWRAAGGRTAVVTATRGELGETIGDDIAGTEGDAEGMRVLRCAELRTALAALGVGGHWFLDEAADPRASWRDSGMAWASVDEVIAVPADVTARAALVNADRTALDRALRSILTVERPALVATYGPDGGYGHPDHVLTSKLATSVATSMGIPCVWRTISQREANDMRVASEGLWQASRDEYAARTGHRRAIAGPANVIATPDAAGIRYAIDVRPVASLVRAALRAHRSQVQAVREPNSTWDVSASYALSDGRLRVLLGTEEYAPVTQAGEVA
ncbi:hypothetical protein GCM10010401_18230 [Rarobacter faecitabidus]|uniref:N-acetyl-1-D-myo-inositol-2-amino-2-deoxy-alpha-D-glucopyranoside deacetylase n=1 Tax=Rarobacter faecitabidus TaxID=13243 RepID=A0A542ZUJ0_RARFA|nr:PIG-L family deacetylase [Rarobacter faecitabidus]TQL64033.1 N-acetyl-1-D-myo-inositol-2-amino-2-deoxy-alpha-D-glucopyranoside deacetylase [Rarobacter faecitabidus]